ncbi:uncharacterized protein N7529_004315 [Penicillium soppii]|uniref:uncharacterized protein n=1 Tax=Penicillium soppii TaxID=69789 RepID=UPI002547ECAA|nr:uncharacterized protein N7529_004315 [Penicillium soppii]KAJ5871962.1 hypothetical protein N7529_004315 [Penicillium soppii]
MKLVLLLKHLDDALYTIVSSLLSGQTDEISALELGISAELVKLTNRRILSIASRLRDTKRERKASVKM